MMLTPLMAVHSDASMSLFRFRYDYDVDKILTKYRDIDTDTTFSKQISK